MADNIPECTANHGSNVVKIYAARKQIEMKAGRSKKRRVTEGGYSCGRWTKEEHLAFIRGKSSGEKWASAA